MQPDTGIILLAGGSGTRAGQDVPKQFCRVAGKTILEHSHEALRKMLPDSRMVIVSPIDRVEQVRDMFKHDLRVVVTYGGASRQESTWRGLNLWRDQAPDHVIIHDAARPFLAPRIISDVLEALKKNEAIDVAIATSDTIIVEQDGYIQSIPKRDRLMRGQTPQAFNYKALMRCYEEIGEERLDQFTDDCGIYLECNPLARIRIVKGDEENFKITHPIDLTLADEMFRLRSANLSVEQVGIHAQGKRVLIFGGTAGIGKALTDILTQAGARVISRSRSNGCDIREWAQVKAATDSASHELGGLDLIVNAAGMLTKGPLSESPLNDISEQIQINLLGAAWVAKAGHEHLRKSRGMLIQFASSSYTRGRSDYVIYSATKAAIVNMTQGLSEEWAQDGIRVNCIIPGRTDTDMRRHNFTGESQASLFNPYEVALSAAKIASGEASGILKRVH
jgi:2-C-methyl-D-erythritol 4-phosphate cytidylyltransferase